MGCPTGSAGKTATTSECIPGCAGRACCSAMSPKRSKDIPDVGEFTKVSPGEPAGAGNGGGSNVTN